MIILKTVIICPCSENEKGESTKYIDSSPKKHVQVFRGYKTSILATDRHIQAFLSTTKTPWSTFHIQLKQPLLRPTYRTGSWRLQTQEHKYNFESSH